MKSQLNHSKKRAWVSNDILIILAQKLQEHIANQEFKVLSTKTEENSLHKYESATLMTASPDGLDDVSLCYNL